MFVVVVIVISCVMDGHECINTGPDPHIAGPKADEECGAPPTAPPLHTHYYDHIPPHICHSDAWSIKNAFMGPILFGD